MFEGKAILSEIRSLKEELQRVQNTMNFIIHGLRQDNRDLLNRVMVKHMGEYAATSPASVAEMDEIPAQKLAQEDRFAQEHFAGEIINET
jgi:hypothetical protein